MAEFVRLSNVSKSFGGVRALVGVNLDVAAGEVLALVGENGAGKSTLMKILSGTYPSGSFSGEIRLEGQLVEFRSPLDAENAGIAIIHQELSSFPDLTVAENLFVGHWPTQAGLIDWTKLREDARHWLKQVGADISPDTRMGDLNTGNQQLVEIAKALSRNSRLLILDEPTSSLTPKEVEKLYALVRQLKSQGKALIYISHKMEEIYELSDRITVLRDGQTVHTAAARDLPEQALITQMVGRSLDRLFPTPPERTIGETLLRVEGLLTRSRETHRAYGPISFELKRGEILGFAGLLGAGRTELIRGLLGDSAFKSQGRTEFKKKTGALKGPRDAIRRGLGLVGEDRKRDSIFEVRSLDENAGISRLVTSNLGCYVQASREIEKTKNSLAQLKTRYSDPNQAIRELSGGNQQKIVIARVLQTEPDVIILDEPTRGVDVGAKYEIYQILFELVKSGKGLIVISSDLPELMALSDRIVVLSDGRPAGELKRAEFSQTAIMTLAVSSQEKSSIHPN